MTKKPKSKQALGDWGEALAGRFLEDKGYRILARKARTDYGEIDLVTQKEGRLVFVEVKTRASGEFGNPEEAVTELKAQHMIDSAQQYLLDHPECEGDWQIDVIAVKVDKKKRTHEVVHFENAITG